MKKAIIGIISAPHMKGGYTPNYGTPGHYLQQVEAFGGIPVQIPLMENAGEEEWDTYISMCDGFVLPGGGDLDPSWFGEEMLPNLTADEDNLSMKLQENALNFVRKAVLSGKPILGICLGMQVLNIAFGGSIYQDIPTQCDTDINHSTKINCLEDRWKLVHKAKLSDGSLLRKISGMNEIEVNSFHHQSVKKVGEGFMASAIAEDGIIEAIEHENGKVIGTQWHPENMSHAGIKYAENLFHWLIGTASARSSCVVHNKEEF